MPTIAAQEKYAEQLVTAGSLFNDLCYSGALRWLADRQSGHQESGGTAQRNRHPVVSRNDRSRAVSDLTRPAFALSPVTAVPSVTAAPSVTSRALDRLRELRGS